MTRRSVRFSLVLIMLAVTANSAFTFFQAEQQLEAQQRDEHAFMSQSWKLTVSLSELRAAEQAYVAAGQDTSYWVEKVSAAVIDITAGLITLRKMAFTSGATQAIDETTTILGRISYIDVLVREHTASGQDLMASDLIFSDGFELVTQAANQLELARATEERTHWAFQQQRRRSQIIAAGTSSIAAILVAFLLLPVRRKPPPAATVKQEQDAASDAITVMSPVSADAEGTDALSQLQSVPSESETSSIEVSADQATLKRVAELCTYVSRLDDPNELSQILEHAADLLGASGLILWVRNSSGTGLRPAIGHGYTLETLDKLGPVRYETNNAAAEAYRSQQLQVAPAVDRSTPGALVVPLLAPKHCVGVLSVEVQAGSENSETVQATAEILAAQLATIITPDPTTGIDSDISIQEERAQG